MRNQLLPLNVRTAPDASGALVPPPAGGEGVGALVLFVPRAIANAAKIITMRIMAAIGTDCCWDKQFDVWNKAFCGRFHQCLGKNGYGKLKPRALTDIGSIG